MSEAGSETNTETSALERKYLARQAVLETVMTHFMIKVSQRLDQDSRIINDAMIAAEDDFRATKKHAAPQERDAAAEAYDYFQDYTARLLAAMTPRHNRN